MPRKDLIRIVTELIEFDPSLSERREELMRSAQILLEAKPDTGFSESFRRKLKNELRTKFFPDAPSPFSISSLISLMNKFLYALGGAAVAAIAVFVVMSGSPKGVPGNPQNALAPTSGAPEVAIGNKAPMPAVVPPQRDEHGTVNPVPPTVSARPQAGGGGPAYGVAGGGGGGMMDSTMPVPDMMPPYDYTQLTFSYGGSIPLPSGDVQVMERKLPGGAESTSILRSSFAEDLLNVSTLPAMQVQSLSFFQQSGDQFNMYVDFQGGNISLNKTYQGYADGQPRLSERSMPSDQQAIAAAKDFLADYKVDASKYGEPVVQDDWRVMYQMAPTKADYWFPEIINVVFPYSVNGMDVYDDWGNLQGLNVSVDVRSLRGTGFYGLQTMDMKSSNFAAVSDEARFREALSRGGVDVYVDPNAKKSEAMLGEPKMALLAHYSWDPATGIGKQLYIPALVFPVAKFPEGSQDFSRKAVVIPLADEFLTPQEQQVMPMGKPIMEPMRDGVEE